jgi:hypothetical protein
MPINPTVSQLTHLTNAAAGAAHLRRVSPLQRVSRQNLFTTVQCEPRTERGGAVGVRDPPREADPRRDHKKPARELNEGKLVLHLVEKIEKQLEVLRGRSLTPTSGDP